MTSDAGPSLEDLSCAISAVGDLIDAVRIDQWSAPTPCTEWTVRILVNHLVGMNLVFAALLSGAASPVRGGDRLGDDPSGAFRDSSSALTDAFDRPGVLEETFHGPLGSATGMDRLQIRLYDLLVHGWDLARATGQHWELPDELAEKSLQFAQIQLSGQSRTGRFDPPRDVPDDEPAIDRLAAFLGRSTGA